jgi:3-hydroxybutyryl-CoA dehydrogenase
VTERSVLIVGAGTMGAGIAQVALEAGWHVRITDVAPDASERARGRIRDGLLRRAAKRTPPVDPSTWADAQLGRLRTSREPISDAVKGTELVIEAALEDLELKQRLFAELDAAADEATILASNTSALSITRIAEATNRPWRVIGLHFFNPAPLLPLVEVVAGAARDEAILSRAAAIVAAWGKTPIRCADHPGFIVNRVNRPYTLEALRLLRAGEGSVESIDRALERAGFPMGPFALMDLIGIDVNLAAARGLFEAFHRVPRFRPSPIQEALVASGHLGRKTAEGFYRYAESGRATGPATEFARADWSAGGGATPLDDEAVSERIILAIVNEAYRALGDKVATSDDIDRAMRLGANHPFGPFEWARDTGLTEVAAMLDALTADDADTFRPSMALLRAVRAEVASR